MKPQAQESLDRYLEKLRIQQRAGHPIHGIGRPAQGELVGEVGELLGAVDHVQRERDRGLDYPPRRRLRAMV